MVGNGEIGSFATWFDIPTGRLPQYTATDEGFVASYPDGWIDGADPAFETMPLADAQYVSGAEWVGTTGDGALAGMSGPELGESDGVWPTGSGNQQRSNATPRIMIDNRLGTTPVLAKAEECQEGFFEVPAGETSRRRIDGIKPGAWLGSGEPVWSQDWYKVNFSAPVLIQADGEPVRNLPIPAYSLPECNYDGVCRNVPGDLLYKKLGGRKAEPEWSLLFSDWKPELSQTPEVRKQQCGG